MMDTDPWKQMRRLSSRTFASSLHFAVASVDEQGDPIVTPIGTLFLGEPGHAYYFEFYATALGARLEKNPRVSVLAVDSGKWFWGRSLVGGAFGGVPAVRLRAVASPTARTATVDELRRLRRRLGLARFLPGGRRLWPGINDAPRRAQRVFVRDLRIDRIEVMRFGAMTVPLDARGSCEVTIRPPTITRVDEAGDRGPEARDE